MRYSPVPKELQLTWRRLVLALVLDGQGCVQCSNFQHYSGIVFRWYELHIFRVPQWHITAELLPYHRMWSNEIVGRRVFLSKGGQFVGKLIWTVDVWSREMVSCLKISVADLAVLSIEMH